MALLAKGTAFILPVALLLLEYFQGRKWSWKQQAGEKLPFIILMGIAIYLAWQGQSQSGSLSAHQDVLLSLGTAAQNLFVYAFKALFPIHLSGFHPFPLDPGLTWTHYLSLLGLPLLAWLLYKAFFRAKELFWGLACCLLCLLPLLQGITFGKAIIAERYSYLAYLGLFFSFVWLFFHFWKKKENRRWLLLPLLAVVLYSTSSLMYHRHWKNSETFWSHVISQYPDHDFAYRARAKYYLKKNKTAAAEADILQARRLAPRDWESWYLLGLVYEQKKDFQQAILSYEQAIAQGGTVAPAHLNRAILLTRILRKPEDALPDFDAAIRLRPDYALAYFNRGVVHKILQQPQAALQDYNKAIELEPWNAVFYRNRALLHQAMQQPEKARADARKADSLGHFFSF